MRTKRIISDKKSIYFTISEHIALYNISFTLGFKNLYTRLFCSIYKNDSLLIYNLNELIW